MGNPKEAIIDYTSAINSLQRGCYYNNRGNCYLGLNMLDHAYKDYKKAIELEKDNNIYIGNLGNVCLMLKMFE
jgi:tetratricopeptide (TPR) repeat protein